ncbi:hypothetical protein SAMN05518672_103766 [Chitinophaga sp. CF118]|uniref:type IX secretion system outer membrane channel protein PorV n=1 Tax=Chitinophaga sp. CF118 TaxID=1884367 RepID=UPI0008E0AA84|nr:type IX secretion system outer membrane channel protein PorV [Chitinophaga sp. CF118]SFD89939.1 hypothetical protein SAMN05518672_103766 [Chitinophaga sp. CF118]
MIRFSFRSASLAALFAMGIPVTIQAQNKIINVATSAAPFLRVSPDARAGGMGEIGIATSPDANASFYNLSKIVFNKEANGVGASYTPWLRDISSNIYLATITGYHKLDEVQAISASLRYFNLGNLQFSDVSGNPLGSSHPKEFSLEAGYARKLSGKLSLALAARYIYSKLASGTASNSLISYKAGNAFGMDVSMFYNAVNEDGKGIAAGLTLTNLGSRMNYSSNSNSKEYLPANFGLGAAYSLPMDGKSKFQFGLDVNKLLTPVPPTDSVGIANYYEYNVLKSYFKSFGSNNGGLKAFQTSLGAEYSYNNEFFIRAGYFYEDKYHGGRNYITTGIGYKYTTAMFNIAYVVPSGNGITRSPLSNTLRFGVTVNIP